MPATLDAVRPVSEASDEVDAVVQGLSETPFMSDVERWGALTIGTGLGNARFTNRTAAGKD